MNKDALLATAIGFVIGLAITGLLLVGPSLMQKLPKISVKLPDFSRSMQKKPTPTAPNQGLDQLSIDSPINEAIESSKELLISGKAPAGSIIVIQGHTQDTAVNTSDDGTFAGKIILVEGKNDITITATSKNGMLSQAITVFYTPESL